MPNYNRPLVTIGIPTYNRANGHLKEALESAINQSYPNIEIIVSDNCSTDHTSTLVSSYFDPRIRYFKHHVNIGANNNFNFCLQKAQGQFFLLLHDDDTIDGDFIEACIDAADGNFNVGIIRTGTRIMDENGIVYAENPNRVQGLSTAEFFVGWLSGRTALYLCSTLFNTTRLKEIGGFKSKTNLFQDVLAEAKLAASFGRIDVRDVKASFRRHNENMGSRAKVGDWCEDSLLLLDTLCTLAPESKSILRRQGAIYFSRKNYKLASKIRSPIKCISTYLMVFKRFGYQYSPLHYLAYRIERRVRKAMGTSA